MYSTSGPLNQPPNEALQKLVLLRQGRKNTHWLTSDLRLVPSTPTSRFFFTYLIKHVNCLRALFFNIDLEEARHKLVQIGWRAVNLRNLKELRLYRKAIKTFNVYAPNHTVPDIKGYYLDRLVQQISRTRYTNLITSAPLSDHQILLLSQNRGVGLAIDHIRVAVRSFERLGGHVHSLLPISTRESDKGFGLRKTDDIATVCHAGHVRSKIAKEVIEQKTGIKTRPTHGMLSGYYALEATQPETDFKEYFEAAFLKKRSKRFGHEIPLEKLRNHFIQNYWSKTNREGRTLFITFSNTFYAVIEELKKHHPNIKNVHIVIIPDGDWISHYQPSQNCINAVQRQIYPDTMAHILFQNESILLNNPAFEMDDYFIEQVKGLLKQEHPEEHLYDFLQPYAYRYAFYFYSKFFHLEEI